MMSMPVKVQLERRAIGLLDWASGILDWTVGQKWTQGGTVDAKIH